MQHSRCSNENCSRCHTSQQQRDGIYRSKSRVGADEGYSAAAAAAAAGAVAATAGATGCPSRKIEVTRGFNSLRYENCNEEPHDRAVSCSLSKSLVAAPTKVRHVTGKTNRWLVERGNAHVFLAVFSKFNLHCRRVVEEIACEGKRWGIKGRRSSRVSLWGMLLLLLLLRYNFIPTYILFGCLYDLHHSINRSAATTTFSMICAISTIFNMCIKRYKPLPSHYSAARSRQFLRNASRRRGRQRPAALCCVLPQFSCKKAIFQIG
jgi:hypothetical protein